MKISESAERLTIDDVPRGTWLLGLVFVASGSFVLTVPWLSAEWKTFVAWERLAVIAIGLGHLGGGLYTVIRAVATRTVFDRARNEGLHEVRRVWPFSARLSAPFTLADARRVEIVRSRDNDGDPVFQLRLWLAASRTLWLQAQPVHGESRVRDAADRVRQFLDLATRV